MYYVYFLKLSNGRVYKGSTSDLKRRVGEHEAGKAASTKPHRPLLLIGYEAYSKKSDALHRERFLKTTEGRRLFRQQYRDILRTDEGQQRIPGGEVAYRRLRRGKVV